MTGIAKCLIAPVLLFLSSTTTAQNQDKGKAEVKLSPVQLLAGYTLRVTPGIDTWAGAISKDGGMKIGIYQGLHVGIEAESVDKKDVAWREEQIVNGQQVICVYTKSSDLIVSFPRLIVNFQGHIRNRQDLADMLLMVLTYDTTHGYPVPPGTVAITPRPTQ